MIEELKHTPNTLVGFHVTGEVTRQDFDNVVVPAVHELVKRTNKLNYLLILDTDLKNMTVGSWLKDAMATLNNFGKWNRAAIVTEFDELDTSRFNQVVPGEYRVFKRQELDEAIAWAGEQSGPVPVQVFAEEGEKED
jgi:hypothetical protein